PHAFYNDITLQAGGPSYREAKGGILRTADTGGWLRLLLVGCPFGFHNILLRMLRCKEHRAAFCRGRHRRGRAVMDSYVEEKHVYILIFIATRERLHTLPSWMWKTASALVIDPCRGGVFGKSN